MKAVICQTIALLSTGAVGGCHDRVMDWTVYNSSFFSSLCLPLFLTRAPFDQSRLIYAYALISL